MIAFDTNVVLRLLIGDDGAQRTKAERVLAGAVGNEEPILLTDIVLCEVDWALRAAYGVPASERLDVLRELLAQPPWVFEDRERLRTAVDGVAAGRGDLSDQLLGLRGAAAGARTTFTFDRALRKDARFEVL